MKIVCNLYSQWIAGIRQEMTNVGFDHSVLSDQDCAIRWQAWKRRIIPAKIRRVLKAKGFNCPSRLQQGLTDLEQAFATGAEIWPWQSKLVDRPDVEDGLYNDYRVTHFHLGVDHESSGYITRTGELLFAIVDSGTVHEIGVYEHGDWYELDILDIIDENWPDLLKAVSIRALDVTKCLKTREEVKAIREAHVVSIIRLKSGRIISPPGGGVATNGTSLEAVRSADYWTRVLRDGEQMIVASIKEQIQKGDLEVRDQEIFLHATDDEISGVLDKTHKWTLWKKT